MIKKIYFLFVFLLAGNALIAQTYSADSLFSFIIHGKVYDDSTGAPLFNHEVIINSEEGYTKHALTDIDGFYADTIAGLINPEVIIHVSTFDCQNLLHSQSVTAVILQAVVNFAICGSVAPPTFNLGGLVFAGNFPINNPESTGDTGIAYLYRTTTLGLLPVDSNQFTRYGYYMFLNLLPGDYMVRVELTRGSTQIQEYFPSYTGNEIRWKVGSTVHLGDSCVYNANIHLLPRPGVASGTGNIAGFVVAAAKTRTDPVVPCAEVILYDQNFVPLDYRVTLSDGTFTFETIPMGTYQLYTEVPGKYSKFTTVVLSEASPNAHDVRLELFLKDVTGITDPGSPDQELGAVYPNPAGEMIHIDGNFIQTEKVSWSIFSVSGQKTMTGEQIFPQGKSQITISTDSLSGGMYFLMAVKEDGTLLRTLKFSKR